jgi:tRNA1(Val) A37 N6-methylase TrmN6
MTPQDPAASTIVTDDALLNGRVRLLQPESGYRAAIDPVLLAAAIPAAAGDLVLDIGCGAGAAALCLAVRTGCRIVGIDADRVAVRLAGDNVMRNGLTGRIMILAGDLMRPPQRLEPGSFAHVMANPPFLSAGTATPSPVDGKARAHVEGEADLATWLRFALTMVRSKGTITFIHRADRIETLLALLAGRAGEIVIFPLWAGADKDAKRVIVRARKGVASPTRLTSGLILHEADGRYTEAADSVLRQGAALPIGIPPA